MNISAIPISSNLPVTSTDVGIAVLAKNLDTIRQAGASMIKMMEQSVNPHLGNNIDIRV